MFNHIQHNFPSLIQENVDGIRKYVTPSGERYPSVTTVLSEYNKQGILEWRKKVGEEEANRVSRHAANRGTKVHSVIENYLNNKVVDSKLLFPNVKSLFFRMKPELDKLNNIHCLEQKMFSHELELAGTVDCIAEYDGVLSVVDFKTSRKWKEENHIRNYFMQGTAYCEMFRERVGISVEQVVIMIGVDEHNYAQVVKVDPKDYLDELKFYISKFRGH